MDAFVNTIGKEELHCFQVQPSDLVKVLGVRECGVPAPRMAYKGRAHILLKCGEATPILQATVPRRASFVHFFILHNPIRFNVLMLYLEAPLYI
jgi:hypothetical protein